LRAITGGAITGSLHRLLWTNPHSKVKKADLKEKLMNSPRRLPAPVTGLLCLCLGRRQSGSRATGLQRDLSTADDATQLTIIGGPGDPLPQGSTAQQSQYAQLEGKLCTDLFAVVQ
jgi:hypothetical protein